MKQATLDVELTLTWYADAVWALAEPELAGEMAYQRLKLPQDQCVELECRRGYGGHMDRV